MLAFNLLLILIANSDGAKILGVFPAASFSHQVVFRIYTEALAKSGHQVTVITPMPAYNGTPPVNIREVDTSNETAEVFRQGFAEKITVTGDHEHTLATHEAFLNVLTDTFNVWLQIDEVYEVLKEEYDLVVVEAISASVMALSHTIKAPFIQISSLSALHWNSLAVGEPVYPAYYPEPTRKRVFNLNFFEKISAFIHEVKIFILSDEVNRKINGVIKKHFKEDTPNIEELLGNVEALLLNVHSVWDVNRPVPPALAYVEGLHLKTERKLPDELKAMLDNSKQGVIYMSFGTNVDPRNLDPDRIDVFCRVFAKLPYDVLWKYSGAPKGKPANVNTSSWLPQSDLLRHPNIKLFITQGGLQSTDEAIEAGVPVIVTPMIGDQWYNAELVVKNGAGKLLHFPTLTEEILLKAIHDVLDDESYKNNVKKLKFLLRDQPQSPLQRAVWWTEHVLRHRGAAHLRCPAADISWTEYLMLDVVLVLFAGILVVFLCFVIVFRRVNRFLSCSSKLLKSNSA